MFGSHRNINLPYINRDSLEPSVVMAQFRAKKLDLSCFVNVRVRDAHSILPG